MKTGFVPTENYRRLKEAERALAVRGAVESSLVLVSGVFGVGKSMLTEKWALEGGHVFLRAKEVWSKASMLRDLAVRMGLPIDGTTAQIQDRIIAQLAGEPATLIIDEAEHLIPTSRVNRGGQRVAPMLEALRDITDITGAPLFLVGMERLPAMIAPFEHIASRVWRVVRLAPLSLDDVQATVDAKCEVALAPEVVQAIHVQSKARMRWVLQAISMLEVWAATNGWQRVEAQHIKGRALCHEFTGQSVAQGRLA
ncbi:MAG: AAA family ATPase [Ottowia sp.]|nr:AAA family ATPase [Ottowia sp.]